MITCSNCHMIISEFVIFNSYMCPFCGFINNNHSPQPNKETQEAIDELESGGGQLFCGSVAEMLIQFTKDEIESQRDTLILLTAINDYRTTKDHLAQLMAERLTLEKNVDWKKVNAAIIKRWSIQELCDIKNRAWSIITKRLNNNSNNGE